MRAPTLWPVRLAAFEVLEITKVITSRESPLHLANTFIAFLPPASRPQECARNYTGFSRQVQIMSTFYLPRRFKRVAFVGRSHSHKTLGAKRRIGGQACTTISKVRYVSSLSPSTGQRQGATARPLGERNEPIPGPPVRRLGLAVLGRFAESASWSAEYYQGGLR